MTRTLLCFGDSNTHGTVPMRDVAALMERFPRRERWVALLQGALPGWEVIAEGHPGRTTVHDDPVGGAHKNALRVLPALLESHRPVDLVLLMLGTNDLKERFGVNAQDIALSLERLLREIGNSRAGPGGGAPPVLLVAPPPILETGCLAAEFSGGAAKSRALGAELARVAARNDLPFIDLGAHVRVSEIDGVHYDAGANPVIARVLAGAVRQHFP